MRNMGRVKEKTSTTGLASYELTASTTNLLRARDVHADLAWVEYYCADGSNFERGVGQLTYGSPDTISRADVRILQSSNGNARVNWSSGGIRDIFIDPMPGCTPLIDVSGARTVSAQDLGALLRFTGSSAATWTLPSAANLGDGFSFEFLNAGTGLVTIGDIAYGPGDSGKVVSSAAAWYQQSAIRSPKNLINGGLLSNNGADANNDIDFAPARARDSTDTYEMILLAIVTKRLDAAWAAGTGQGGLFSGAKAVSTCYHCFLIRKTSDGSFDAGFDTSVTAANIPSGYSAYCLLESILTDVSGNIRAFVHGNGRMLWSAPINDENTGAIGIAASLHQLESLPLGRAVNALIIGLMTNAGSTSAILLTSPSQADTAPVVNSICTAQINAIGDAASIQETILTDTSRQIRARATAASTGLALSVTGWLDLKRLE